MIAKRLLIVLVLALAAAVAGFWFLALAPLREEASALQAQIDTRQGELDAARSSIVTYERARDAYPANYAKVARLGKAVPADDDVRSLIVQLDAAAKRSGAQFQVIEVGKSGSATPAPAPAGDPAAEAGKVIPGATPNAAGFSTLPMTFSFHGSYFELSELMTRLERFVTVSNRSIDVTGRLLLLQSVSLVPDTEGFPHMRAEIKAASYLVPAPPAVEAADAAAAEGAGSTAKAATTSSGAVPPTAAATTSTAVTGATR